MASAVTKKPAAPKMPSDNLILTVADALDVRLTKSPMGVLVGSQERRVMVGGMFPLRPLSSVRADQQTEDMLSAYIRIAGDLWGYIVAKEETLSRARLWFYFVDGQNAKLTVADLPDICTGDARKTIELLTPFLLGPTLEYDPKTLQWKELAPKVPATA